MKASDLKLTEDKKINDFLDRGDTTIKSVEVDKDNPLSVNLNFSIEFDPKNAPTGKEFLEAMFGKK